MKNPSSIPEFMQKSKISPTNQDGGAAA